MRRCARPLLVVATVAIVLGLGKAHAVRHGYDFSSSARLTWTLGYAALLILTAYGAGLPELTGSRRSALGAGLASTSLAAVAVAVLQLVTGSAVLPRFVLLSAPLIVMPAYLLCARLAADGQVRDRSRERVVAVATLDEGIQLADELNGQPLRSGHAGRPERPALLVEVLSPDDASSTDPAVRPLVDVVRAAGATAVVLDRHAQADESIVAQAAELHEGGVRVRTLSLFYDEWLGKLPVSELERVGLMFDIGELHRARYGRLKRMVDSSLAAVGLVALAIVTPVVVIGNMVGNRGPLLYRQARVGKGGRTFQMIKFRTMRPGAGTSTEWTTDDDPRITPFGAWLRRSHLDELPQVVNILRGDLSVVGPRPEQPQYVEDLTGKIPFYNFRHLVRPGLTGWAQVKYPYGANDLDAVEKLQYEFYYLRHQRLLFDMRIIGRTVRSVVGRGGK